MSVNELKEKLAQVEQEAFKDLESLDSMHLLENIRLKYLGQKGALTEVLRGLGQLSKEERPLFGQLANQIKEKIQEALEKQRLVLEQKELQAKLSTEKIDITLPAIGNKLGHVHPLTQISNEIISIFGGMGFTAVEGPEIETDYYNFDALNTPADHPARDSQDTFYTNIGPQILLRSHTSCVQLRALEKQKPPIRIISLGRVYRNEEVTARKYPLFHQTDGILIDQNVTFGQLKGVLNEFIRILFGRPLKTRFRPDFFPFTEPSAELDSECLFCSGSGCRTCGHRGWLELLGCGMVDPNVLAEANIDPEKYSGFAWGMGVERFAMLKYGINDIRHLYSSDLRFLEQF